MRGCFSSSFSLDSFSRVMLVREFVILVEAVWVTIHFEFLSRGTDEAVDTAVECRREEEDEEEE